MYSSTGWLTLRSRRRTMDIVFISVVSTAFIAVAGMAFVAGEFVLSRNQLQRRLAPETPPIEASPKSSQGLFDGFVKETFTEARFGVDGKLRKKLADRLGLDEAASFVSVLRHSLELGGDVAASLRVFSDEMRSKRMLVAEAKANELPVK